MTIQAFIDIQKHNNKINRILNKISQKQPGLSEQLDIALYSCLKIQRIIKKINEANKDQIQEFKQVNRKNADSTIVLNDQDQLYQNALNIVEGFKTATKKLQKKVDILLRQEQIMRNIQKAKHNYNLTGQQKHRFEEENIKHYTVKNKNRLPSYENISPFSPHIIQNSQRKSKHNFISSGSKGKSHHKSQKIKINKYIKDQQSFQSQAENNQSKDIRQIDQQIIQLTSQIKHMMTGN